MITYNIDKRACNHESKRILYLHYHWPAHVNRTGYAITERKYLNVVCRKSVLFTLFSRWDRLSRW